MKNNRKGRAAVLSPAQLDQVILALPGGTHQVLANVLRRTGCRISEATHLTWECISNSTILFPCTITKGKLKSRDIPLHPDLEKILQEWRSKWSLLKGRDPTPSDWIFPGRVPKHPITENAFGLALKHATKKLNIGGVSTHSFRRSALSAASAAGIPLRDIQELSGHESLAVLQRYLEVSEEAKKKAALAFA